MEVTLPFKTGDIILEVGGGDNPLFRPNLDFRKSASVDIVGNLEGRWPIEDELYEGVFGKFIIEHISWRLIPDFVSECYRVLKPGGVVVMISPNTLAQCQEITRIGDIGTNESALLFGGQEDIGVGIGWNEHKAAFSPNYAERLFKRAGFYKVEIETWPGQIWTGATTDMIIKAYKRSDCSHIKGNRHQWIRDKVKIFAPNIDLGVGPKPTMWEGRAYNIKTVDENEEFHPDIIAKAHSVPVDSKSFDNVILGDILEHYYDADQLLKEAFRIAKKKVVITVPWEERWSKNLTPFQHHDHKVNYTKTLLEKTLSKYGYDFETEEIVVDVDHRGNKENEHWVWVGAVVNLDKIREGSKAVNWYQDLDKQMQQKYVETKSIETRKLGLNIGSFTVMTKSTDKTQWINYDIRGDIAGFAQQNGYEFSQLDATKGLPWKDNTADCIIASHFLEHITRKEADFFLEECYRVMKPGAVIRLTVPDIKVISEVYLNPEFQGAVLGTSLKECFKENEGVKNAEDEAEALWNFLTAGHKTAYDEIALKKKMEKAGFIDVQEMKEGQSRSPEIQNETKDMYPDHSIYMEGVKPENNAIHRKPTMNFQDNDVSVSYKNNMRIGLVSTQFFGCPPKGYSGLEMIVWDLACGLSKLGHEVILFAPEGSKAPPNGKLVVTGPALQTVGVNWVAAEEEASKVYLKYIDMCDIIHGHNWFGFEYNALGSDKKIKVCHTHHGHLDQNWWLRSKPPYKLNFIGISKWMKSNYEKMGMPSEYVYNGIDIDKYVFKKEKGNRMLFVGRLDTFKQPHVAMNIAMKMGIGLDIVGGSFVQDQNYLKEIKEHCDGKIIKLYLDCPHEEKISLMQNAKCLLFPSKMGEPFGLVACESMACGTSVVALNDGAISEVVTPDVGFVCSSEDEMVQKINLVEAISPEKCRERVEKNFSRNVMAKRYEELYKKLLKGEEW